MKKKKKKNYKKISLSNFIFKNNNIFNKYI